MNTYSVRNITQNKGAPRLWLEGKAPEEVGFKPGARYDILVDTESKRVSLKLIEAGYRTVSQKERGGKTIPVIDINSKLILQVFEGMNCVRVIMRTNEIHIIPEVVEVKKTERLNRLDAKIKSGQPLTIGSISHGGGILSNALHKGLGQAGIDTRLSFANDIRDDLLEQAAIVNDAWSKDTIRVSAPMQSLVMDSWMMAKLGVVDLVELGLPCSGASVAGRAKNATSMAEQHEDVGHLVAPAIQLISLLNPVVVLLENVKPYQSTASMWILRHSLRDMGYQVHETVLNAGDFNELEHRERLCMVAVTAGIDFDFNSLVKPTKVNRKLGEVLEHVPDDDKRWSSFDYLVKHQQKHAAKGNGFSMQLFDENSGHINTITKGYAKIRSSDPRLRHPNNGLMRQLTLKEHARVKGIPERFISGMNLTTGHEMLGQSVCYSPFVAVGELIGKSLRKQRLQVTSHQVDLVSAG